MTTLWQDFRYALRTLAGTPGFTAVALATLALGIGVNTAMFSVANAVLWRSVPYRDAARVVWVGEVDAKNPENRWGVSYGNFRDWQARSHSFEQIAAVMNRTWTLREGANPSRIAGFAVSREYFDILGIAPVAGRIFTREEDRRGAAPVVILSDRLWRERFGADPAILGRTLHFDDLTATVIGIMPADFPLGGDGFWVPLDAVIEPHFVSHREVWVLWSFARLRPGVSLADAQKEMTAVGAQIRVEHPETVRNLVMRVNPLQNETSRDLRPALLALMGAVGVVLLIACANLAGLMSVRASARAREMAIRSALGAGRGRMIRQLLTESLLLALAGGAAGVGLALWAARALPLLTKDPRLLDIPLDARVFWFALAAAFATSILFGVVPALQASQTDAADALKGGARTGNHPRRHASRQMLVIAQIAMCMVLLVGAGLLWRSFRRVLEVNPGFRADHLMSMRVELPPSYKTVTAVLQSFSQFQERLRTLPGVVDTTMVNTLPITGGEPNGDLNIEGRPAGPGELGAASFRRTLPGYFHTMGIPILQGRDFTDSDDRNHDRAVIISQNIARRFWPAGDAVGHRIIIGPRDSNAWMTIVGVAADVRHVGLDMESGYATYSPIAQQPRLQMEIAIRATGDAQTVLASAQRELRQIEPALMIDKVQSMSQRIEDSVAPRRLNLILFGLFALLALLLAAVGLYGVVAYAAGQRTQEFGIRMALGARSGDVMRLVLGQGLKLAAIGVVIGIAAALALTRLIANLLFGVPAADPVTLIAVAMVLATVALLACWLPARRATRIPPVEALRSE